MTNKDNILTPILNSKTLEPADVSLIVRNCVGVLNNVSELPTASVDNLNDSYLIKGVFYQCELNVSVYEWVAYDGTGVSLDYSDLSNKPKINGQTLSGDVTATDLGLTESPASLTEIAAKTGLKVAVYDTTEAIEADRQKRVDIDDFGQFSADASVLNTVSQNYVKKASQFILTDVSLTANTLYRVEVFNTTGLHMTHKNAFHVSVFDDTYLIPVTVKSNSLDDFYIKSMSSVTATIFVTFMELSWDYEGTIQPYKVQLDQTNYIWGYMYNTEYNTAQGIINPIYPQTGIYPDGAAVSGKFIYYKTGGTIRISGHISAIYIEDTLFSDFVSYDLANNYTILNASTNPFTDVIFPDLGYERDIKIKYI